MNIFSATNVVILLIIALCFGSTFLFISLSLSDFDPLSSGSGRIIIAGTFSLFFAFASGHGLPKTLKLWLYSSAYGIFCLGLPFILIPFALKTITTGEVAIYLSSIPLFILLLARIVLKERITKKKWIGFFIGFSGLILLIGPDSILSGRMTENISAAALCIMASILLAAGGIIIQMMPKVSPIALTGSSLLIASIIMLPVFLMTSPNLSPEPVSLLGLFAVGIFSTFLGSTIRFALIKRTSAVFTSINGFLAPIVASIFGITLLDEKVTIGIILSYIVIVSGVFIAQNMDVYLINTIKNNTLLAGNNKIDD